jgi:YVTN family beta-propeller protein
MLFAATLCVALVGQTALAQEKIPLKQIGDIPLSGRATRFDYQSFDGVSKRLYIAHLGDDMVTVVEITGTGRGSVIADIKGIRSVHGVLAVPELNRLYASATGTNELAVIDTKTLQIVARVPTGDYPDGIGYAGNYRKIYVSNKLGRSETVIDAQTNKVLATISLGGPVGNTQYDSVSGHIFAAVHKLNEIAEIDPASDKVIGRYQLSGCKDSHGLLIDGKNGLAFAACEGNAKVAVFDLAKKKQIAVETVGDGPDVLAFDENLGRLYVSSESGVLTIFDERDGKLVRVSSEFFSKNAHTVAVDSASNQVFFPLQNAGGRPVLRSAVPTDKP